jgi:hypothetical protein
LNNLGHSKEKQFGLKNNRFYSFSTREGRDARNVEIDQSKEGASMPKRKGGKTHRGTNIGPDMIKNTQRYQNILLDNAKADYMKMFSYEKKEKK